MVLEEASGTKIKREDKVTRICDECRMSHNVRYDQILEARRNKERRVDYCKKCSYKYRKLSHPKMEKSSSWNGGRFLNENGYYRIYSGSENSNKYVYEHKLIYEKHIGRKLLASEKVHHIDGDKTNNKIENLFLCDNKTMHWNVHQSMEDCAMSMLNRYIWYDIKNKIYVLECKEKQNIKFNNKNVEKILLLKVYKEKRRERNKYYLRPTDSKKYPKAMHTMMAEEIYGKKLFKGEIVHHINGNTIDNSPNNLIIMSRSEHKKCHYSLQECIKILFSDGRVVFNDGQYEENKE